MQEIRFKRKTPVSEVQAHFACGTNVALTILSVCFTDGKRIECKSIFFQSQGFALCLEHMATVRMIC